MKQTLTKLFPWIFIVLFVFLSVASAKGESLTYDEIVDVEEGKNILLRRQFIEPFNPPFIRELTIFPLIFKSETKPGTKLSEAYFPGRVAAILLGATLIAAVYYTSKRYFDETTAVVAAFLMAFEPNTLGHSHYITMDVGASLMIFLSYVSFLIFLKKRRIGDLVVMGVITGLAFASKILAIPFLAVSAGWVLVLQYKQKIVSALWKRKNWLVIGSIIVLLTIWATYFFTTDVIIAKREDSSRVSAKVVRFAKGHNYPWLVSLVRFGETQPLPLGKYLASLKNTVIRNGANGNVFFFGSFYPTARWYFMPVNTVLKTPLPMLILFAAAIIYWRRGRRRAKNIPLFLIPIASMVIISSLSSLQPWVRYMLPIYPFMAIVAGYSAGRIGSLRGKIIFVFLCAWFAFGSVRMHPHYIAYANEFAGSRQSRFLTLMDSNLDWGQSLPDLQRFIAHNDPSEIRLSYFGRDNADAYGLASDKPYGSHKFEDICAFHTIRYPNSSGPAITVISVSNWYGCGYFRYLDYHANNIMEIIGDSLLVFSRKI